MSPGRAPPTRAGVLRSSTRLPHCVSRHSVRCVRELDRIAVSVRRTGRSCLRPAGWSVHRRHARRRSMKGLAGVAVVVVPRRAADGGYQAGRLDDVASPSSSRVHCHRCTPHDTSSAIFLSTMSTPGPSTTPSRMASWMSGARCSSRMTCVTRARDTPVSYTHLTLPTNTVTCGSRWWP